MKKIKIITFIASLMCLCSCSCSCTSSDKNSGISLVKAEDNYYKNDKYIVGKRIFDDNYFCENAPRLPEGKTFTLEEFPDITFENSGGNAYYEDESGAKLRMTWALYVADINQDGHFDLCYVESVGSGVITYEAYVYDLFNHEFLLEKANRTQNNFYFDLDENNVLCLVEGHPTRTNYQKIHRAGRFLKDSTESLFEWYSYDIKPTDIVVNYSGSRPVATLASELYVYIYAYIDYNSYPAITANNLIIEKVSGPDFAYQVTELNETQGKYTISITFSKPGVSKIRYKFLGISSLKEISINDKF
ncbi:MAG: hypothetical protein J6T15_00005 [Bacilli bacterium]|nr:hypothetical protein [Bacilli bacterium]